MLYKLIGTQLHLLSNMKFTSRFEFVKKKKHICLVSWIEKRYLPRVMSKQDDLNVIHNLLFKLLLLLFYNCGQLITNKKCIFKEISYLHENAEHSNYKTFFEINVYF